MTQEEWEQHSEEWRRGYNAYAHDEYYGRMESHSPEWLDGFRYAMRTAPVGPQTGGQANDKYDQYAAETRQSIYGTDGIEGEDP